MAYILVRDELLPYDAGHYPAFVHVRCFEDHEQQRPLVVVGQLSDHIGPSVGNCAEDIAAAVQSAFYPDGRRWRYVEYWPTPFTECHRSWPQFRELSFTRRRRGLWWRLEQALRRRRGRRRQVMMIIDAEGACRYPLPGPAGEELPWRFTAPLWQPPTEVQVPDGERDAVRRPYPTFPVELIRPTEVLLPELLGDTPVTVWPSELYTAELIGTADVQSMVTLRRAAVRAINDRIWTMADAFTRTTPATIIELNSEDDRD